jgi:hypothetical protein
VSNTIEISPQLSDEVIRAAHRVWRRLTNPSNMRRVEFVAGDLEQTETANQELLSDCARRDIVYMISRGGSSGAWTPLYFGQSKAQYSRQRLRNHLFKKHRKTGSKLSSVQEIVRSGTQLAVSFCVVDPPWLRLPIEAILIEEHSNQLSWNLQGRPCSTPGHR